MECIAPGFIDAQVNGGGGALLNDEPSVATVRRIAESHRNFGTTGLLPTVITDAPEIITAAADAVPRRDARRTCRACSASISKDRSSIRAARRPSAEFIRAIADDDIAWLTHLDCGTVMLTVAPSTVSPEQIRRLAEAGIIVSLGHSEATAAEATAALAAGARGFTHLFNAMSQLGIASPAWSARRSPIADSYCGIIADGHHVDPLALKVALAAKPNGHLYLVTDAMPPAAGGPPHIRLPGPHRHHTQWPPRTRRRHARGLDPHHGRGGALLRRGLGVDLEDALRMASLYPGRLPEARSRTTVA